MFNFNIYGQDELFNDPEFASHTISKNIFSNTDLYRGRNAVNVPIYTYEDKDFTIPISATYSTGGFKTNEPIGTLGIGWNLNFGGYITREVKAIPDEESTVFRLFTYIDFRKSNLFFPNDYDGLWDISRKDWQKNENEQLSDGFSNAPIFAWRKDGIKYDSAPDIFTFNFLGYSGSFFLARTGVRIYNTNHPHGEFHVEVKNGMNGRGYPQLSFIITTGDGYKYTFEDGHAPSGGMDSGRLHKETYFGKSGQSFPQQLTLTSKWFLTKIEAPNKRTVVFEYGDREENGTSFFTFRHVRLWGEGNQYKQYLPNWELAYGYYSQLETIYPIKSIKTDGVSINFTYEEREQEIGLSLNYTTVTIPAVKRLKSISVNDTYNNKAGVFNYLFNYKYSPMPQKITLESGRPVLFLKSIDLGKGEKCSMDYYNENDMFPLITAGTDSWGYYNNASEGASPLGVDPPDFSKAQMGALAKITYPTGGYSKFYYEPHTYELKLAKELKNENKPDLIYTGTTITGGIRIKKITDYVTPNDSTYKTYFYSFREYDGSFDQWSSYGTLLQVPTYRSDFNPPYLSDKYFPSGNLTYPEDKYHIEYSKVYEQLPDGSSWLYEYSDYSLLPDLPNNPSDTIVYLMNHANNGGAPNYYINLFRKYHSRHTQRGKLIAKTHYNKELDPTYIEKYVYDYTKELAYDVFGEFAHSVFYKRKLFYEDYPLIRTEKTTYSYPEELPASQMLETVSYTYNDLGQTIKNQTKNSFGETITKSNLYVNELTKDLGDQDIYDRLNDKNIRKYPIKTQTKIEGKGIIEGKHYIFKERYNASQGGWQERFCLDSIKSIETNYPINNISDFEFDQFLKTNIKYYYNSLDKIMMSHNIKSNEYITYLWAYDGKHIVAKIENAHYEDIDAIVNIEILLKSYNPDMNKLNSLRTTFPSAMITIYTYQPLVGLTSITDPRGITMYCEYDDFNRMKRTYLFENGVEKTIQEYKYNYTNK